MGYKASRARRSFEQEVSIYCQTLRVANTGPVDPRVRQYVIASAIFLGHASLENFIKDLFDGICSAFSSTGVKARDLPDDYRFFIISKSANWESHFSNFQASGDEKKLLGSLAQLLKNPKIPLIDGDKQSPSIRGVEILAGKGYPSQENLERIFSRIGISKIFNEISALLKSDSRLLLKGFSDKRTELAHNAVMTGISTTDVVNELKKIERFVAAIDRICYAHVTSLVKQKSWLAAAC